MSDSAVYCRKTGKPCILCRIGFMDDVLKCEYRYKKEDESQNENQA